MKTELNKCVAAVRGWTGAKRALWEQSRRVEQYLMLKDYQRRLTALIDVHSEWVPYAPDIWSDSKYVAYRDAFLGDHFEEWRARNAVGAGLLTGELELAADKAEELGAIPTLRGLLRDLIWLNGGEPEC